MRTFDIEALFPLLRKVAQSHILPHFLVLEQNGISQKADADDLVTLADLNTENSLTQSLMELYPQALVVGEEAVYREPALLDRVADAELAFIIDPIDGTWNFAHSLPIFAVMIGVTRYGETIAGVIYYPMSQDFIFAVRGQGAFLFHQHTGRQQKLKVAPAVPCEAMSGYILLSQFPIEQRPMLASSLPAFAHVSSFRCSAYEYRLMVQGSVHFVLNAHLNSWDHAAGQLIHTEAGGYSALTDGRPYSPLLREGQLLLAPDIISWLKTRALLLGDGIG
ncbi:inositol monophosphatase [Buttiauxella sp. A2-C2_NF]|uniref:inositol monophosphatase family protein n=1 Tax=Buttiauxella ferragutiae TaxID=82989 RepID=UPI001E60D6B8|nr:inositol monophosphatase [Buttiauxella ferragutiae]MCE0828829.1 inositol monophosphatase [Buttiauxella ferragutiae]